MGVAAGGATLEIQLVADVARLKRDMADMRSAVQSATGGAEAAFRRTAASTAASATQMAAAAQAAARSAMGMAGGIGVASSTAAVGRHHMTNLAFQVQDLGMQMAMAAQSSRPLSMGLMALFQQGTQIQGIGMQTGLSFRQLGLEMLRMVGIVKVTKDAELASAAAYAASAAAAIKSQADRAVAAVAARQTQVALIQAELAAATSAEAQAAAEAKLVAALRALEVAAGRATTANQALATAQAEAAAASEASAAKTVVSIGRLGRILGVGAIAAGVLAAAFGSVKSAAEGSDEQLKHYISTLGLTRDEIKKLKDTHVTWGDVASATFQVLAERAGISMAQVKSVSSTVFTFIGDFAKHTVASIVAAFGALVALVGSAFTNLGKIVVNALGGAANTAIDIFEKMLNKIIGGINKVADFFGMKLLDPVKFDRITEKLKLTNPLVDAGHQFQQTYRDVISGFDKIGRAADALRDKRVKQQADEMIADRHAKKARKEREDAATKELAMLDTQIRGQWRLVDAYLASDAAAMRAEARLKAEEKALQKKGDAEAFYAKELALAVAQRAVAGAKDINNLRAETAARKAVNDQVAAGVIPASEANGQLALEQRLRPLVAAATVAEGDEKQRLLELVKDLRAAQANLNAEIAREAALRQMAKNSDEVDKLRLEAQLLGASNRERAVRLAQLEAERFIRDNKIAPDQQGGVVQSYVSAAIAAEDLREAQVAYNGELTATLDMLTLIGEQSQVLGQIMSDAFGPVGESIGGILTSLTAWQTKEQEIADWKARAVKEAGTNAAQLANIEAQAAKKSQVAQMQAIGGALAAAKTLFKEKSAGYKVMTAIEKAYAAFQAVQTAIAIARDIAHTASSIANSTARTTANTAEGGSKIFAQLGVWAFPVVAAMVAVLAALGARGGGGGSSSPSIPSAEDVQAAQGAGTVLGDSSAKSQSIANALELLAKNSTKGNDYSSEMVRSLRKIESGIGNLAAAVARSLQLSGGFFDAAGMNLGESGSSGFLGMFGSSKTRSLYDQGLQIDAATVGDIIANGISGLTYNVIETVKKSSGFFGIGGGTKTSYSTTTGGLDPEIARQFQLIIGDIQKSVVDAAKVLGFDVGEALSVFQVEIGKISFKDLKGDEITQALEAVFSKVADQMAGFAVFGLEQFQKAGEGLFETLERLAKDYLTIDTALQSIGLTFGSVGASSIAAREALIDLMGGLDEFVSQINYYYEHFLTTSEQQSFLQLQVNAAFQQMGLSVPATIDAFKALVNAQDLTTEAGQATFAALMAVAPAFYELETAAQQAAAAAKAAAEQLAKQRKQLEIQLLEAEGKAAEALAMKRQMELDAMDASLRALQKQVWAAQDVAKAKDDLSAAYKRESQTLQQTADKFHKFADTLRDFRDTLFASADSPLTYNRALAKLIAQSGLAAAGNEAALGGGLRDAASQFLDAAKANAGTLQDLQRARAFVARQVDQAIGGAEGQASIAEQQLDQLKDQVSALISIDEHVLTVAEAIDRLNVLLAAPPPSTGGGGGGGGHPRTPRDHGDHDHGPRIVHHLEQMQAAVEAGAVASNKMARVLDRVTRDGTAITVVTDDDTPIQVQSA